MNSDVIFKLLGFTLAMVAAPISMYFLTVNSIFSGELSDPLVIHPVAVIDTGENRELNIRRGHGGSHGEYRSVCLYYCRVARGSRGESSGNQGEGKESSIIC